MKLKKKLVNRVLCTIMALTIGVSSAFVVPPVQTVQAAEDNDNKDTTDEKKNNKRQAGISGDEIVAMARSYIGKVDYVYAGKNLNTGVDCSGFVCCIFEMFGINLWPYRSDTDDPVSGWMFYSYKQFGTYIGKDPKLAQAGDLIITTDHVAIATGEGTAISALNPRVGVLEHSLLNEWASSYFGGYDEGGGWIIIRPFGVKAHAVYNDPYHGILNGVDYSSVYNYSYYRNKYPDLRIAYGNVAKKKSDSTNYAIAEKYLLHFINYGMKEGRQASEEFCVKAYRSNYEDLRNAYGDDLARYYWHYIKAGKKEKRNGKYVKKPTTVYNGVDYSQVYDFRFYQRMNPDVKAYYGEDDEGTLRHFVVIGMQEGRRAKATFDIRAYVNQYQDLRRAFKNNNEAYYRHYMKYGEKEGRIATKVSKLQDYETVYRGQYGPNMDYSMVYDYNYYVKNNPDVKAAFGNDDVAVLEHFVRYGMKEGRRAKATFDLKYYKNSAENADLRAAYGVNKEDNYKYYIHYLRWGYKEKRKATK